MKIIILMFSVISTMLAACGGGPTADAQGVSEPSQTVPVAPAAPSLPVVVPVTHAEPATPVQVDSVPVVPTSDVTDDTTSGAYYDNDEQLCVAMIE